MKKKIPVLCKFRIFHIAMFMPDCHSQLSLHRLHDNYSVVTQRLLHVAALANEVAVVFDGLMCSQLAPYFCPVHVVGSLSTAT